MSNIKMKKAEIIRAEESARKTHQDLENSRSWWEQAIKELREASSLPEFLDRLDEALVTERLVHVACEAADVIRRLVLARVHSGRGRELIASSLEELSKLLQGGGYFVAAAAFAAAAAKIRGERPTWWAAQLLEERLYAPLLFRLLRLAEKAEKPESRVPNLRDPDWPDSRVATRMMVAIRGLALPHPGGVWEYPGWALCPARLRQHLLSFLSPPQTPPQKPAGKDTPAPAQRPGPESLGARARLKRPAPESNNGAA